MREPAMTAVPIASTDLRQHGLYRVRLILEHLFAHLDRGSQTCKQAATSPQKQT
jgi:hypothetical protein